MKTVTIAIIEPQILSERDLGLKTFLIDKIRNPTNSLYVLLKNTQVSISE